MKELEKLKGLLSEGRIDRRDFILRASALGVAGAIPGIVLTEEARAAGPKRGGKFRQAVRGGATSDSLEGGALLDTHNILTSWQVRNNLTEVTAEGGVVGELAEDWEASADAGTWVFNLRKGVEFHNGKSLDAEDVIHSINTHRGEGSKSGASGVVAGIDDIKADGNHRVVFSLKTGSADFPFLMADYHLTIVPSGTMGAEWEEGMGTGPFVLSAWDPGVRSAGKRNPNYFKSGRPWFDEVETLNVGDVSARVNALRTGEVDAIEEPDLKTVHLLDKDPDMVVKEVGGYKHFTYPMRTDRPPYDNNHVRLALKYGVDRNAILQTVLRGHGYLGNDHPIGTIHRYFASELEQRHFDADRARFHLKKAGIENATFKLHAGDIYPGGTDAALLYKEHAAKAGIDIEVVREPTDGYWSNVWMQKDFSVAYWGGRPTEDWMFSVAYADSSAWNDTYWRHDKFNQLLVAARAELDEARRRQMYVEMQSICRDEGGVVIPVFANWINVISGKVGTPDVIAGNWPMDGDKSAERWWFL